MKEISIIIPVFNEEKTIADALLAIREYCIARGYDYEIIVVDDGSTDRTREIVGRCSDPHMRMLENGSNRGKGHAVRQGVLAARKEWVLFTDADLSAPLENLETFAGYCNADIIIGSRALPRSIIKVRQPVHREIGGRLINVFTRLFLLRGINDTQCGFKFFKKECAHHLFFLQTVSGWGFDIEVLFLAKKFDYRMVEVPVRWRNRSDTKIRPIRDGLHIIKDIMSVRRNNARGVYDS